MHMPSAVPCIVFAAMPIIAVLVVMGIISAVRRRREFVAWAAARGLTLYPDDDREMDERYPFDCLQQGHDRLAYDICTGVIDGYEILLFHYDYETGSGDDESTWTLSAVILQSPFPLRPLLIRPEGMLDRVSAFFGADDIDFESAEFSRRFFVKSPDRKWAYDIIHQRMMEFLLESPQLTVEFSEDTMIVWDNGVFSIREFENAINLATGIMDRIPEYVINQQTGKG